MIRVYNTMSREKEDFEPQDDTVRMYVCGPTVYNFIHIGNGRAEVVFDIVRRYLEFKGYSVKMVENITDVDDHIIEQSIEEGIPFEEVARRYTREYLSDVQALNIKEPDVRPKASEHIEDMIGTIEALIEKGHAYESGGDVYFSVSTSDDYCKLSHHNLEDLQAGARVDPDSRKRDPLDFALWKASKPGEPWWESPWGQGRPGWHIECSTMSTNYLGSSLDIHGGGLDLIFPHHENEIQQSEKATGSVPFVRYWMHNGYLTIDEEKMSKSLGNQTTVRDLRHHYHPRVLRFLLINTHYRKPLDFNTEALDEATDAYLRIFNAYHTARRALRLMDEGRWPFEGEDDFGTAINGLGSSFEGAMDDDFNTRGGIAALFDLVRELNGSLEYLSRKGIVDAIAMMERIDTVLGILAETPVPDDEVDRLALEREEFRKAKDFTRSDEIRDSLAGKGVSLQDANGWTRVEYTIMPPAEIE